jgi:enoyl-CoA hydratase
MGLANRLCEPGQALTVAHELAESLARLPQRCMRSDRRSAYEQWTLPLDEALANETALGLEVIRSPEMIAEVQRWASTRPS